MKRVMAVLLALSLATSVYGQSGYSDIRAEIDALMQMQPGTAAYRNQSAKVQLLLNKVSEAHREYVDQWEQLAESADQRIENALRRADEIRIGSYERRARLHERHGAPVTTDGSWVDMPTSITDGKEMLDNIRRIYERLSPNARIIANHDYRVTYERIQRMSKP